MTAHAAPYRPLAAPPAPAPAVSRPARTSGSLWAWADGLAIFIVFVVATLVMVVAVVAVGAVDGWWVLVPVMAVDLMLTFVVIAGLMQLLADDE